MPNSSSEFTAFLANEGLKAAFFYRHAKARRIFQTTEQQIDNLNNSFWGFRVRIRVLGLGQKSGCPNKLLEQFPVVHVV